MEFKKEDFILIHTFEDKMFLALRPDYFAGGVNFRTGKEKFDYLREKERLKKEVVKEAIEEEIEKMVEGAVPTEEELAEIEKQKLIEEKKAELAKLLEE